jgi:branched-chain amino acid transport system substrate-binding protein
MKRRTFTVSTLAMFASFTMSFFMTANGGGAALAAEKKLLFVNTTPLSGAFADYGKSATLGAQLAVKEAGKVLGREIDLVTIDTESNPGKAARKIQEVIEQKNARFFSGAALSSEALAIGKEVNKAGGVFFTPVGADEITGSECNKSTFRWSVPTYGAAEQTVRALAKRMPQAQRWYTITPQYVFGDAILGNAKKIFADMGITHVGNSYHSLKETEFSGYLAEAMAAKPDVLVLFNFAAQSSATLRQAVSFGMKNKMTILVAWTSGLDQFSSLGPEILEGVYLGAQYWHAVSNPENKAFVALTRKHYGINPTYPIAADYIETKLILNAITSAKSDDPAKVIAKLEGLKYKGLTGDEEIRAFDHQVIKDYYLLKGKKKSAMTDADDFAEIISSGKSFVSQKDSACKMK